MVFYANRFLFVFLQSKINNKKKNTKIGHLCYMERLQSGTDTEPRSRSIVEPPPSLCKTACGSHSILHLH